MHHGNWREDRLLDSIEIKMIMFFFLTHLGIIIISGGFQRLQLCFLLWCKSSFYYIFLDMSEFHEVFSKAKHIAIITGAGVSAESGVPTFRGKNEKWRKWLSQVTHKEAAHTFTWMHFIFSFLISFFFFFRLYLCFPFQLNMPLDCAFWWQPSDL